MRLRGGRKRPHATRMLAHLVRSYVIYGRINRAPAPLILLLVSLRLYDDRARTEKISSFVLRDRKHKGSAPKAIRFVVTTAYQPSPDDISPASRYSGLETGGEKWRDENLSSLFRRHRVYRAEGRIERAHRTRLTRNLRA
ncbi:hypothetical protein Trydic_g2854 [Trypoxylus dichotomus]